MTDATTFTDYDASDGWNDGLEICPHCGMEYAGEGRYHGTVFTASGTEYDHFMETDASNGPFYCPECFKELEANRRASENESIEEFL